LKWTNSQMTPNSQGVTMTPLRFLPSTKPSPSWLENNVYPERMVYAKLKKVW
jgi:hypothetical protein